MKILIIGHGGSGKDTAAEALSEYFDLVYNGPTSVHILDAMLSAYRSGELKGEYSAALEAVCGGDVSFEKAYEQRRHIRKELFSFGEDGRKTMGDLVWVNSALQQGSDIICGIRNKEEMRQAVNSFDAVLWVYGNEAEEDPTLRYRIEDVLSALEVPSKFYLIINDKTKTHLIAKVLNWFTGFCDLYNGLTPIW